MLAVKTRAEDTLRPRGATPEGAFTRSLDFDSGAQAYVFGYRGDISIDYVVDVDSEPLLAGLLQVGARIEGGELFYPVVDGGTRYRAAGGAVLDPRAAAAVAAVDLLSHGMDDGRLQLSFRETIAGKQTWKTFAFELVGRTLVISVSSESTDGEGNYAGLSLGHAEGLPGLSAFDMPFLREWVIHSANGVFISSYIDAGLSSAVSFVPVVHEVGSGISAHLQSTNQPDTAGRVAPLSETAYVTVSPDVWDVVPGIQNPPSPYRDDLARRVVLDVWNGERHYPVNPTRVSARVWVAPVAGSARLEVDAAADASDTSCSDGVLLRVLHDDEELLSQLLLPGEGQGVERSWQREIAMGDTLTFQLAPHHHHSCDSTRLRARIVFPGAVYDSLSDFRDVQGFRGWFYREFDGTSDSEMTWDAARSLWAGRRRGESFPATLTAGGGHPPENPSFLAARGLVERYHEYGMRDLLVIFHDWQRHGYDQGLPSHFPPNEHKGGLSGLGSLVAGARELGYLVALHENYEDLYPDNPPEFPSPYYDEALIAKNPDGSRRLGWFNSHTQQQAFVIAADKIASILDLESSRVADALDPGACYLDITTAWAPTRLIDFDAANSTPKTSRESVRLIKGVLERHRELFGGPHLGEGGEYSRRYDTYLAGYVDGVERQIEGHWNAAVIPDFELLSVRPLMIGHGMGYPGRFFVDGGLPQDANQLVEEVDLRRYRALEIAFGHAGFLFEGWAGGRVAALAANFTEYYLVRAAQEAYLRGEVVSIDYWNEERWLSLGAAVRAGYAFRDARVRIVYDNGTVVYVNAWTGRGSARSVEDFSGVQGRSGWSYLEWDGDVYRPMRWDAQIAGWRGSEANAVITFRGAHPHRVESVRRWTSPVDGSCVVTGAASNGHPLGEGDGTVLTIYRNGANGTVLFGAELAAGDRTGVSFSFEVAVAEGETLDFHVGQGGNFAFDYTDFEARVAYQADDRAPWIVPSTRGDLALPSMGFLVENVGASTSVYSTLQDGRRFDYAESERYRFLGVEDSVVLTHGGLSTDGALAVMPSTQDGTRDLHLVGATLARDEDLGRDLIVTSVPADVNVNFRDPDTILMSARTLVPMTLDVTYDDFPTHWLDEEARLRPVEVSRLNEWLEVRSAPEHFAPSGSSLTIAALRTDAVVRISLLEPHFVRSDTNGDMVVDVSDPFRLLLALFVGRSLPCVAAADANADGNVEVTDAIFALTFLFQGGEPPPPPYPVCGPRSNEDLLPCEDFAACL